MTDSAKTTSSASRDGSPPSQPFGLWTLTFLVVANMVGAGVFTTSGFALADLGTPDRVMAAWSVGGAIALSGAWSYGRLVRAMPESGGEYLFLSRAAHPVLGFIAGWVSLIAGFTGAIAFAATALESYAVPEPQRPAWLPQDAVAIGVVVLGGVAHGQRARGGATLQNVAVALKLTLLIGLSGLALLWLPGTARENPALPTESVPTGWALAAAFATSLVWISLSYSGFNAAVYVAGEAREPKRTVPKALVIGASTVFMLYILLNAVLVYGPPHDQIAGVADVAAVTAEWAGGSVAATIVRAVIGLALLTSVLSMVMAAPRVYAKMAEDGLMPGFLRLRGSAPAAATAAQVVLASVFILISSLQSLLSYLGLTLSLCAALSASCLFLPRVRRPERLGRRLRTHFAAVLYIVATLSVATVMTVNDPKQVVGTVVTFLVGGMVYAGIRLTRRAPLTAV